MEKVRWVASNQVVQAPLIGLEVKENDHIGAVVGTGDILFAMIAEGAFVESADTDPKQIEYVKLRMGQVRADKHHDFLYSGLELNVYSTPKEIAARTAYFSDQKRWEQLKRNISKLKDPDLEDIGKFVGGKRFDKIFLSNAAGWGWTGETEGGMIAGDIDCRRIFDICSKSLDQGGLVYRVRFGFQWFFGKEYEGFELDKDLTQKAQRSEQSSWITEVYRGV
ncbi:MAG: hypothetical protein WC595_04530 [Candidatus Nanoarchaeia archaeon]